MAPQQSRKPLNRAAQIDAYLLSGIGVMLLQKVRTGTLELYVHPRYTPLILVAGCVLLLLGVVRIWQVESPSGGLRRRIGAYGLLLAPLVLGMLIPAAPVGSTLVDSAQLNNVAAFQRTLPPITDDTQSWDLLNWTFARYTYTPKQLQGKPVDVIGFVYHDSTRSSNEFDVTRYAIVCCVADRRGLSLRVRVTDAAALPDNQWVRVTGRLEASSGNGMVDAVVVDAHVEPVEQPRRPYLYPYN